MVPIDGRANEECSAVPQPAQCAVLDQIWEASLLPRVREARDPPEAALRQLLKAGSPYGEGTAGGLASFGSGEVSLPRGQAQLCPLDTVLEGEALADIRDLEGRVLLSPEELEARTESEPLPPVWHDPALAQSRSKYLGFLQQIYECKLISFTSSPIC